VVEGLSSAGKGAALLTCRRRAAPRDHQGVCAPSPQGVSLGFGAATLNCSGVEQVFPNMGFQQQLRLWEAMGCRLDPDNAALRRYALTVQGRRWAETGDVDPATLPMPTDADIDQVCLPCCT